MRRSLGPCDRYPVFHDSGLKVAADQLEHPLVIDLSGDPRHQDVVVYPVKELLQIGIHHPAPALFDVIPGLLHRKCGTASRSKAVAVSRERLFKQRTQDLMQGLLDESILYAGNSQHTLTTSGFGYLYLAYR